ncbi:GDP-L-fucose synthase [Opitutales bacterium]|jgi:GDP-L-fucose synthase|nr:GDP-L-fucose synthase [Opitutales bacterium]MDB2681892.1 GDP-L-fucose synthase [Opitutales bacterium]
MKKLLIFGARGMVGSALVRAANQRGYTDILAPSSRDLDLLNQAATYAYLQEHRPDAVIVAAAKVGGIHANSTYPAEFMLQNLAIAQNTIDGAYKAGVQRLIFLGSTCIYPKFAEQPIKEESLLTSALEPTNEAYAIAKIAGLKMCEYYRRQYGVCYHSAMPTNLYGQGDNYHPQNSHVLPALIRRFHEAKANHTAEVAIWGTGTPLREFLHADDAADGILHLLELENPPEWVNLGCGTDISIGDLARLVRAAVGYEGELTFDTSKPDGTPRKLTDISKIKETGWAPKIPIEQGVAMAYQSFLDEQAAGTLRE